MRLIDADALLERMKRTSRYFNVKFDIEEAPTIEAEPVRHGRWISYHESDFMWDEYGYRCSECQIEIEKEDFRAMFNKRCPNCGAKMGGGS